MKIMIYTLFQQGQCYFNYAMSLVDLCKLIDSTGNQYIIHCEANEALVQRGRNAACAKFLESDCDVLLMIDADIGFNADGVMKMLDMKKQVAAAPFVVKRQDWELLIPALENGMDPSQVICQYAHYTPDKEIDPTIPFEVERIGTGLISIRRECLEEMKDSVQQYHDYQCGLDVWDWFGLTKNEQRNSLMSESYSFCELYRSIGGRVWAVPFIKTSHMGPMIFSGDLMQTHKLFKKLEGGDD